MPATSRPEAIDSSLVFLVYAWLATAGGLVVYAWAPLLLDDLNFPGVPFGRAATVRTIGAIVAAFGMCAFGFARVTEPISRQRCLLWFAGAHLLGGALFMLQWIAIFDTVLPPSAGSAALMCGIVLLYLAVTGPGLQLRRSSMTIQAHDGAVKHDVIALRSRPSLEALRSRYEEQIRQAARQEERARLARDLHDAVKQQLFVIQTAAATAQTRFDADAEGARAAVEQVRCSAREAMTEMEAMLDQLQAVPIENSGLVAAVRKQCEALGFRTGAEVTFELGRLPAETAMSPGAREAILRAAQEALANVARHARARKVQVALGTQGRDLVMSVTDDGSGCRPDGTQGMGVANMAARVREHGGSFELMSVPTHGTTVRLSVPCDNRSPREYAARAGMSALGFVAAAVLLLVSSATLRPWAAALAAIAAIAAVRHIVASYRVRAGGMPA